MADMRRQMESLGFSGHVESADAGHRPTRDRKSAEEGSLLAERLAGLAGIVQEEVVPRLVEAYRPISNEPLVPEAALNKSQADIVTELSELVVKDGAGARAYVQQLQDHGLSVEVIYLNVLAPTARLLGELWEADRRHFADVTVGVGRLQQMLHDFEAAFQSAASAWQPSLRVLLMPAPHEQHTFGLFMLGEFMRRAGWDAWTGPMPSKPELKTLITGGDFSVVGFSASSDCRLDHLTETIKMVRRLSKQRRLCIMVGGGVFMADPSLVAKVGADGTAADAKEAIKLAHSLVGESAESPRKG